MMVSKSEGGKKEILSRKEFLKRLSRYLNSWASLDEHRNWNNEQEQIYKDCIRDIFKKYPQLYSYMEFDDSV
jgi:hypothetical protein